MTGYQKLRLTFANGFYMVFFIVIIIAGFFQCSYTLFFFLLENDLGIYT